MMIRNLLSVLAAIILSCNTQASTDSLVLFNDLVFKNRFEATAFSHFINKDETQYSFALMFATVETDLIEEDISKYKNVINAKSKELKEEIKSKAESKTIKIIFNNVHNQFLDLYEAENRFSQIFTLGKYNCVSATALYAYIFENLNIPFQIKELPTHVYLVAYPNSSKILVETTAPQNGYFQFSEEFAQRYVKTLYKQKLISRNEYETKTTSELFNENFFSKENLSLKEMTGIQYYNLCLYYFKDNKYDEALNNARKAFYLYPCERTRFMLKNTLLVAPVHDKITEEEKVKNLLTLCRYNNLYNDEDINSSFLSESYNSIIAYHLTEKSDLEKASAIHALLLETAKDTVMLNKFNFWYHYELARLSLLKTIKAGNPLENLKISYEINPDHADLKNLILGAIFQSVGEMNDSKAIQNYITSLNNDFPFLSKHEDFITIKAAVYLDIALRSFTSNNLPNGNTNLELFENLYQTGKPSGKLSQAIEAAYSGAAGIYFKKGNYSKAKEYI
ncbi:MAG: hypothetical protein IPJ79_09655 [Bacteroidetes bacterium]|nr:hypothetical protein [Bacteroidota bacterium]